MLKATTTITSTPPKHIGTIIEIDSNYPLFPFKTCPFHPNKNKIIHVFIKNFSPCQTRILKCPGINSDNHYVQLPQLSLKTLYWR